MMFSLLLISYIVNYDKVNEEKQELVNQFTERAQKQGLTDVEIVLSNGKSKRYDIIIKSSNLESLSFEEMIELDKNINIDDYECSYSCNGNIYNIYPSVYIVDKNGEMVFYDKDKADADYDYLENLYNNIEIEVTDDSKAMC